MTKFKVDLEKDLYQQSWWKRLKPEVKLKAIKLWEETTVDEAYANGSLINDPKDDYEFVVDLSIPKRSMIVTIPTNQLTEKK